MELKTWIEENCATQTFADIHIDRIDPRWKAREEWVRGGAEVLISGAATIVNRQRCRLRMAVVYTLNEKSPGIGSIESLNSLSDAMDHSPPSLFIASPGSEPWLTSVSDSRVSVLQLSEAAVSKLFPVRGCSGIVMDFWSTPDDLIKTLWFVPKGEAADVQGNL